MITSESRAIVVFFANYFRKITKLTKLINKDLKIKGNLIKILGNKELPENTYIINGCKILEFNLVEGLTAYKLFDWDDNLVETDQKVDFYQDTLMNLKKLGLLVREVEVRIPTVETYGYSSISKKLQKRIDEIPKVKLKDVPLNFYFSKRALEESIEKILSNPRLIRFENKEEYQAFQELRQRDLEQQEQISKDKQIRVKRLAELYISRKNGGSLLIKSFSDLLELDPIEFERWVKKYIFEVDGWEVKETKRTHDGGVDLILFKPQSHQRSIAQCKRYIGSVGESYVRDFYGTMVSEDADIGYFITTGLFTLSAKEFALNKPIKMIDKIKLQKIL